MNEHEMTDLMDRAGSGLHPDVARLVAGGTARGRRQRRRRRSGVAFGAALAVGAVAALGYAVVPGGEPRGTDRTPVAAAPAPAAPNERQMAPGPKQTGAMLAALLESRGAVTKPRAWTDAPEQYRAGSVLLDGALVNLMIERTTLPGCGELPPGRACASAGDDNLSTATYREPMAQSGLSDVVASTATLFTADGFAITATAWNASAEKYADPVSARPVLSEEQLTALVQDPAWLTGETGATRPTGPSGSGEDDAPAVPVTVAAADVPGVVAGLLGEGEGTPALTEGPYPLVDSASEKIVHFRWNGTLTTVTFDPAAKRADCRRQARDTDGATCAREGGNEVIRWGPNPTGVSAQGVSVWQQGWIVSVVSYNAADGKDATPLLPEPAITLDELAAVAASDVWFR